MFSNLHSLSVTLPMNLILESNNGEGALWLGDYTAANNRSKLTEKDIKTVLTVASGLDIHY